MLRIAWESWRKTPQFNHIYVSSLGRVKVNKKLYRPKVNSKGYLIVEVEPGKYQKLHRLVASAFLKENLERYETIDHKDSNKRNNAVSNLEIVSAKENERRAKEVFVNDENLNFHTGKISDWNIRITDGQNVYRTLHRAANFYATKHSITKDVAISKIFATLFYNKPGDYPWRIVEENK